MKNWFGKGMCVGLCAVLWMLYIPRESMADTWSEGGFQVDINPGENWDYEFSGSLQDSQIPQDPWPEEQNGQWNMDYGQEDSVGQGELAGWDDAGQGDNPSQGEDSVPVENDIQREDSVPVENDIQRGDFVPGEIYVQREDSIWEENDVPVDNVQGDYAHEENYTRVETYDQENIYGQGEEDRQGVVYRGEDLSGWEDREIQEEAGKEEAEQPERLTLSLQTSSSQELYVQVEGNIQAAVISCQADQKECYYHWEGGHIVPEISYEDPVKEIYLVLRSISGELYTLRKQIHER